MGPNDSLVCKRAALQARANPSHGPDLQTQLQNLRGYAISQGWTIAGEYVDRRGSGAKSSWPSLNRLRRDAKRRAFDVVLTLRLDRFGRSLPHLVRALTELETLGIDFISVGDGLSMTRSSNPPAGRILAALAEFEGSRIQERIRDGLHKASRQGRNGGRRRAPVDETAVVAMRESGASWRAISKELGIGVGTAFRIGRSRSKNIPTSITESSLTGNSLPEPFV